MRSGRSEHTSSLRARRRAGLEHGAIGWKAPKLTVQAGIAYSQNVTGSGNEMSVSTERVGAGNLGRHMRDTTSRGIEPFRAIRIPWLLEELNVPYKLEVSQRNPAGVGPQEFKDKIPAQLKKSPTIRVKGDAKDGSDLVMQESGAIVE